MNTGLALAQGASSPVSDAMLHASDADGTSGGAHNTGDFPLALVVDDANGDIYVAQGNPSTAGGSVLKVTSLNIAVTGPTNAGNLRLHPGGTAVPLVSSINFKVGQTRSNNAVVPLSALGQLGAFLDQAAGTAHLIIDVNGYFK